MTKQLTAATKTTDEQIVSRIHLVRGQKVMLDKDLAEMYGVETSRLNEAVKRNRSRFPDNVMIQLTKPEFQSLISQIAISKTEGRGGTRKLPYTFTEHGVLALAFVLRSERAVQVSSQIIDVYIKMRQLLLENKELWQRIESMERRMDKKDEEVQAIFAAFKKFLIQEEKPRNTIGFKLPPKKQKK